MKKDFVSLAEARPDLAKEWNYEKNGDLKPEDVGVHSHKKVWWFQYDVSPVTGKKMKLEWNAIIDNRVKGAGNPIKSGYLVVHEYNDLTSLRPDLAKEWNYEKNGKLTPDMVTCGSSKKVWWIQYDTNPTTGKIIKLEWKASINNRVKGNDCPIKSGRQVLKGYNDLASLRPDLAAEWNYEKNDNLTPDMITCGSGKNIWWMQYDTSPVTGELMRLEWQDTVNNRTNGKGHGNPIKSGRQVLKGYNDLASLRPDLAKEWNYKRNSKLTPEMVTCGCNKKVWWIQYDVSPTTGEIIPLEWKATVVGRVNGMGNPIRSGYQILKGYNDLASLRPDIAAEWNYEKNGNLTPNMVTCGCHKNVWWVQYDINPITQEKVKLEWKSTIKNRVNGNGNPYKSGKAMLKGYNDFASLRPDLAK